MRKQLEALAKQKADVEAQARGLAYLLKEEQRKSAEYRELAARAANASSRVAESRKGCKYSSFFQ